MTAQLSLNPLVSVSKRALYHGYTAFLFTKSDLKTIQIPITLFAYLVSPKISLPSFLHASLWTWLNLLQFCVSNQSLNVSEDAKNKPWRPITAFRLSQGTAFRLRWLLLVLCLAFSTWSGIPVTGAIFTVGVILHNEMKLDSHWLSRNILNALGYITFDYGATTLMRPDGQPASKEQFLSVQCLSALIVLTTIHAQDFRDEEGDRVEGRKTMPIVMPEIARLSMPLALVAWSIALFGRPSGDYALVWANIAFLCSGTFVGYRFYRFRTMKQDQLSYLLYNVWLCLSRVVLVHRVVS